MAEYCHSVKRKSANTSEKLLFKMNKLGEKIKIAANSMGGLNELADKAGIARRTLGDYVSGKSEPKFSTLVDIANLTGRSLDWFNKAQGQSGDQPSHAQQKVNSGIELVGLASCGVEGWQRPSQRKTRTQTISGLSDDAFVVMTFGDSLVPMGISDAMICYCDPSYDLVPGDIVYLERNDNTASLKRFEGFLTIGGHDAMSVVGWQENGSKLDHSDNFTGEGLLRPGQFEEYRLDIDMANLKRFAPVIYVKRRL